MALTKSQRREYAEAIKARVGIVQYFSEIIKPELSSYYDDYSSDLEATHVVKCPLHTEDTPSFRWYPDTDSCYCFGCGRGGDVIALHRHFIETSAGVKPTYDDALEFLYHRYVEGKTAAAPGMQNIGVPSYMQANQPLSTSTEVVLFLKFVKDLEGTLAVDVSVPLESKMAMYGAIDVARNLVDKNVVPAPSALHWLKHKKTDILLRRTV